MSRRRALLPALAASLALTLAACGSDSTTDTAEPTGDASGDTTAAATDGKGSEDDPVVIGVVGASDPQWPLFEQLAEDHGARHALMFCQLPDHCVQGRRERDVYSRV